MTDEEAVFAYIDGELGAEERARIEAKIAADPALQTLVAEHRAMKERLERAFATILDEPAQQEIGGEKGDAIAQDNIVSLTEAPRRREHGRASWKPVHWAAMAASLVVGVMGGVLAIGENAGPVARNGNELVASGGLEAALDTQLASNQGDNPKVRIGLTFRNRDGVICRSFSFDAAEGVACREAGSWQLQGLLRSDDADGGAYRMASSSAIADLVDGLIVGKPMDGTQERQAFKQGWDTSGRN